MWFCNDLKSWKICFINAFSYNFSQLNVLFRFKKKGTNLKDLHVVIGPAISQKNYEVQKEFKFKFLNKTLSNRIFFKTKQKKLYFDIVGYISNQIIKTGVKNIEIIRKDT